MNPLHDLVVYMLIRRWRLAYAEEREYPEYVDLGGES